MKFHGYRPLLAIVLSLGLGVSCTSGDLGPTAPPAVPQFGSVTVVGALAVGAGVLLSGSSSDMKAAAATVTATKGASSRIGTVLDDLVAQVVSGFHGAIESKVEDLANDVKRAIGAPMGGSNGASRSYGANVNSGANATQSSASSFNTGSSDGASAEVPRAD